MRTNKYLEALQELVSSKDMGYCNCGKPNQVGGFSCKQHCEHGKALQYVNQRKMILEKLPLLKKIRKKDLRRISPIVLKMIKVRSILMLN